MIPFSVISDNVAKTILDILIDDNVKYVAVVGMGASNANTRALESFASLARPIIYLDCLEQEALDSSLALMNNKNSIFVAISKSGNTDEVIKILEYIVSTKIQDPTCFCISGDADSKLGRWAKKSHNFHFIQYEQSPSGRFSIFQNASLLPIHLAGGNLEALITKIKHSLDLGAENLIQFLNENLKLKRNIIVISIYNQKLMGLAIWLRQIISESLGKNGFGITPIISLASVCEHSQMQLYQDGPDDKIYYILPFVESGNSSPLNKAHKLHAEYFLQSIKNAERPIFIEQTLGIDIISKWMKAIYSIASANNINPYNQDSVDTMKKLYYTKYHTKDDE